ncbi:MAG TPA: hypothetical protein VJ565_05460, partial [Dehalococcoidia bacterium]|nr:hypothetical protein [Dehalococcoidia bacterium]
MEMEEERMKELEDRLSQLQAQVEGKEGDVKALQEKVSLAAQKYRALLLQGAPEVPEELVSGGTVEEVEKSFLAAEVFVFYTPPGEQRFSVYYRRSLDYGQTFGS